MIFAGLVLDIDFTYVLVIALVLIPFLILNGMIFGPFMKLFSERHERLEGAIERADAKIVEAEAKAKSFEEQIEVATRKGIEARNAIRAAASKAMNDRIEAERTKMNDKVGAALAEVEKSRAEAMTSVDAESKRLAEMTASKLLGRGV